MKEEAMNDMVRSRDKQALITARAALVVAIAAVVAAVVGPAVAAPHDVVVRKVVVHKGKVRKGDIAPGAVTMKALAHGAVTANKIRKGAVSASKLAKAAVTPEAIAPGAVNGSAIASGSVSADKLGIESVVTKPIADIDKVAHNGEWTASNTELATCQPGELLLGGGFAFGVPNNGEASWLQAMPVVNGETRGIAGRFMSDAGGGATGQVSATCLR